MRQRVVLHVDCDCFFASVEMRDQPRLRSVPLAIGGQPGQRGVVATCNYVAREFGIRSAMSMAQALQLCPHLVILPSDMAKYREVSGQVMDILRQQASSFEPVSIDEAYLELESQEAGLQVAHRIQQNIDQMLGVSVSVGVAPNRFLAKIASDWNKPGGVFEVLPENVAEFVAGLPVSYIPGVGPKLRMRLNEQGINYGRDLLAWSLPALIHSFGKMGAVLFERCRGVDDRAVGESRKRKSASVEKTFPTDLTTLESCLNSLPELWVSLQERVSRVEATSNVVAPFVKLKFSDFTSTSLSDSCRPMSVHTFERLVELAFQKYQKPVRLIGVGGRFSEASFNQGQLFDALV